MKILDEAQGFHQAGSTVELAFAINKDPKDFDSNLMMFLNWWKFTSDGKKGPIIGSNFTEALSELTSKSNKIRLEYRKNLSVCGRLIMANDSGGETLFFVNESIARITVVTDKKEKLTIGYNRGNEGNITIVNSFNNPSFVHLDRVEPSSSVVEFPKNTY